MASWYTTQCPNEECRATISEREGEEPETCPDCDTDITDADWEKDWDLTETDGRDPDSMPGGHDI